VNNQVINAIRNY